MEHTPAAACSESPNELKSWGSRSGDSKTSTHHDGSGATWAMRASALFLSSGELSQASTAISRSCAYERLARRDCRLMRRETGAAAAALSARKNSPDASSALFRTPNPTREANRFTVYR